MPNANVSAETGQYQPAPEPEPEPEPPPVPAPVDDQAGAQQPAVRIFAPAQGADGGPTLVDVQVVDVCRPGWTS